MHVPRSFFVVRGGESLFVPRFCRQEREEPVYTAFLPSEWREPGCTALPSSGKGGPVHTVFLDFTGRPGVFFQIFQTGSECRKIFSCLIQTYMIAATYFVRGAVAIKGIFPKAYGADVVSSGRLLRKGIEAAAGTFVAHNSSCKTVSGA